MNRRLTKSRTNIVLTGSLAGVAEFFGIDATIVRIIYVLLSLFTLGSPVLIYIALALLMPKAPQGYSRDNRNDYDRGFDHPYKSNPYTNKEARRPRKEAVKVEKDDDDWSDF